jgi:choline dehydrogenase-like flavoprotein
MVGVSGRLPMGKDEPRWSGVPQTPNHILAPRFRNVDRVETNGFLRGYHMTGSCRPVFDMRAPGFGDGFKRNVRDGAYWRMGLGAFCEQLPQYENHVRLNKNQVDAWGIPTLHIRGEYGVNELRMAKDAEYEIAEMLEAAGCKDVAHSGWEYSPPGFAIHEVGTARMGDSPKNSVLNKNCQAWDVPNLFVSDGASWPTVACQNPTLTMMANAVRISTFIAQQAK